MKYAPRVEGPERAGQIEEEEGRADANEFDGEREGNVGVGKC